MRTIKICTILCVLLGFGVSSFAQSVKLRINPQQNPTSARGMIITYWAVLNPYHERHIGEEPYGIPYTTTYTVSGLLLDTEYGFHVRLVSQYGVGAPCVGVIVRTSEGGTPTVYMHDVPEPPRGAKGQMTLVPAQTGFQGINFLDISQFQAKQPTPYRLNE